MFFIKNKNIFVNSLLIFAFLLSFLLPLGFYLYNNYFEIYLLILGLTGKFGQAALLLFLTTLLPGIVQRLKVQVFLIPAATITLFRRQLGILMYVFALLHSFYINTIPFFLDPAFDPTKLTAREMTGSFTIMILFPVFITSNDWSMQKLGRFWKTIQRLTYIAMILIFLHVALMLELPLALLTLIVIGLEIYSWILFKGLIVKK